jgi:hypothetical protein
MEELRRELAPVFSKNREVGFSGCRGAIADHIIVNAIGGGGRLLSICRSVHALQIVLQHLDGDLSSFEQCPRSGPQGSPKPVSMDL